MISRQTDAPPANEALPIRFALTVKKTRMSPSITLRPTATVMILWVPLSITPASELPYAGSRISFVGQACRKSDRREHKQLEENSANSALVESD